MSPGKKGPYVLIILLVVILIFILGVQYGKRVKVADTAISFLLSITPSPSPKPSQIPVTNFTSYTHKGCKLSFLYPSYLKIENESSQEAKLISKDKKQFIKLQCPIKIVSLKESTTSAQIIIDGIQGFTTDDKIKVNNENIATKIIRINRTALPVELLLNKELYPLITTSTEFE